MLNMTINASIPTKSTMLIINYTYHVNFAISLVIKNSQLLFEDIFDFLAFKQGMLKKGIPEPPLESKILEKRLP